MEGPGAAASCHHNKVELSYSDFRYLLHHHILERSKNGDSSYIPIKRVYLV